MNLNIVLSSERRCMCTKIHDVMSQSISNSGCAVLDGVGPSVILRCFTLHESVSKL